MVSVEVIIPVKDMADHVSRAVATLAGQIAAADRITVVDDGSTVPLAETVETAGVNVIRLDRSVGPYGARHVAAAASTADVIVFMDARCRASNGWLDAHRALYDDPDVALSCTGMRIAGEGSLAGRICQETKMFSLESKINVPGRMDFFPTANLGVRTNAYRRVQGFRRMQSGGDVDLCWRVQLEGVGRLGYNPTVLLDWIPRDSVKALFKQWIRYGRSSAQLDAIYAHAKMLAPAQSAVVKPDPHTIGSLKDRVQMSLRGDRKRIPALIGCGALMVANQTAYRRALKHTQEFTTPVSYFDL